MNNNNNNNNTEHARIFKDTPFFTVFCAVAFSLVHFLFNFLEKHGYQCCLLIILIIFEDREKGKDRQKTDRQTENSYSNTKTFCSKDCIPC